MENIGYIIVLVFVHFFENLILTLKSCSIFMKTAKEVFVIIYINGKVNMVILDKIGVK